MDKYKVDVLERLAWLLYKQDDPNRVCEKCWEILFKTQPISAAALLELDSDSTMYVVAHRGLPDELAFLRLPKMDSAVGRAAMITGRPLLVPNVYARPSENPDVLELSPSELRALKKWGFHGVLILPNQSKGHDYVLMLCFPEPQSIGDRDIRLLWRFSKHLVRAFECKQIQLHERALKRLWRVLNPAARIEPDTMDEAAEVIRQSIHAGGVSIFLCSEDGRKLELVGSSPGIDGNPPYHRVYYPLEHRQGLTPEVALKKEVFRYPNLRPTLARDELERLGYVWQDRWRESLDYDSRRIHPFMAVPLLYGKDVEKRCIGVVRASLRQDFEGYFTAQEEHTLCAMAERLTEFVLDIRAAQARTTDAMQHIAHQFLSPLSTVLLQLYELRQEDLTGQQRYELIHSINSLVSTAIIYGRNFELISRIWVGASEDFDFMPVQVDGLLMRLASVYQPLAKENRVNIRVVTDSSDGSVANLPMVRADESAITQAFAVAIDNGIKYSAPETEIVISGEANGDGVFIHVDNISTIPVEPEWQERIFERFERTPAAKEVRVAGTGTGLWLARKVLRLHDGDIVAQASEKVEDGWLTRFSFYLEAAEAHNWSRI